MVFSIQAKTFPVITIRTNTKNRLAAIFILFLLFANITACSQDEESSSLPLLLADQKEAPDREQVPVDSLLDKIKQRGKLIVLTINYPTTYYYDRDNQLSRP